MDDQIPLHYKIACIVLTALFIWAFSIAREPRGWRRLYQSMFSKGDDFSVNKNKGIDELLKRYGIIIAMIILVADVSCFVLGVSYPHRMKRQNMSKEDLFRMNEIQRIQGSSPSRGSTLPQ